jgi:error-prone DNA polymerase
VRICGVDLNDSRVDANLESEAGSTGGHAVRVGLGVVRWVVTETTQRIVAERDLGGPYAAIDELTRRMRLTLPQVEALATAGALVPLKPSRRAVVGGRRRP